jgi:four helix bundle protein
MSRDHRKLKAFTAADGLVVDVYRLTRAMPHEDRYGLTSQIRRAAVSIPTNIVEGCGRVSQAELVRFLSISLGSLRETIYLLELCVRLECLAGPAATPVVNRANECGRLLNGLIQSLSMKGTSVGHD